MTSGTDIDRTAFQLCAALGVDPNAEIVCGLQDTLTPAEAQARRGTKGPVNPSIQAHQWRLFRRLAAETYAVRHVSGQHVREAQGGDGGGDDSGPAVA